MSPPTPSPVSPSVLGGAALVSSPALWRAFVEGTTTVEVAATRYLVSVLVCWLVIGFVAVLVGPAPRPEPASVETQPEPEPETAAVSQVGAPAS